MSLTVCAGDGDVSASSTVSLTRTSKVSAYVVDVDGPNEVAAGDTA